MTSVADSARGRLLALLAAAALAAGCGLADVGGVPFVTWSEIGAVDCARLALAAHKRVEPERYTLVIKAGKTTVSTTAVRIGR